MSKSRKKRMPKRVLALPDLEQAKSAVLNTLTSASGQRTYDHAINDFVEWYCSEPRLAFNRAVESVLKTASLERFQMQSIVPADKLPDTASVFKWIGAILMSLSDTAEALPGIRRCSS